MQVDFVHCSDWYLPVGDGVCVTLGKYKLPVCSHREGVDWEGFKAKAILAGLRIQVFDITGKTSAASILKGDKSTLKFSHTEGKPVETKDDFFPVPADEAPFPVIGDQA